MCTTVLSRTVFSTSRRLCRSPRLALVISFSATGRSTRALASVVVIRPCSNSWVARLATIRRWWDGLPPRRGPFLGLGMALSRFSPAVSGTGVDGAYVDRARRDHVVSTGSTDERSVGLVLDERVVVVVAVRREGGRRVEAGRAVLERETHLVQLRLDLVDRLGPEVADVEQVLLRAADELTHGVDALTLEAVVGPHGQLEVLDREGEVGSQLLVDRRRADVDALGLDVQLAGQAEQLDQGLAGQAIASRGRIDGLV